MSQEKKEAEEASQTQVWERVRFEEAFDYVFERIDTDTIFYIYTKLQKNILNDSPSINRSLGAFDITFSLAKHILEKIGGLDEEIWKDYVWALKSFIKAIYMFENGEKTDIVANEIESAAGQLAAAINGAIEELATAKCEDS